MGVNDALSALFSPYKGIKARGSLNLFLLCAEGFSMILNDAKQKGMVLSVKIGQGVLLLIIYFLQMQLRLGRKLFIIA